MARQRGQRNGASAGAKTRSILDVLRREIILSQQHKPEKKGYGVKQLENKDFLFLFCIFTI